MKISVPVVLITPSYFNQTIIKKNTLQRRHHLTTNHSTDPLKYFENFPTAQLITTHIQQQRQHYTTTHASSTSLLSLTLVSSCLSSSQHNNQPNLYPTFFSMLNHFTAPLHNHFPLDRFLLFPPTRFRDSFSFLGYPSLFYSLQFSFPSIPCIRQTFPSILYWGCWLAKSKRPTMTNFVFSRTHLTTTYVIDIFNPCPSDTKRTSSPTQTYHSQHTTVPTPTHGTPLIPPYIFSPL